MVQCAALNCTVKSGQGLSMFLFPKDPKFRKIWTLKLKRDKFSPSEYTKLCERHFSRDQFSINPDLASAIGFQTKCKVLITGAIPTIFDYTDPNVGPRKRPSSSDLDRQNPASQPPPPKRKSVAVEKRRRIAHFKVLDEAFAVKNASQCNNASTENVPSTSVVEEEGDGIAQPKLDYTEVSSSSKMIQTTYNLVKRRHARIQTELPHIPTVKTVSTGTQTEEACFSESGSPNTSFLSIQDDLEADPDWNPVNETDEISEDYGDIQEENAAKERKFIVFESCLDELFTVCSECGSPCSLEKTASGSLLRVKSLCDNCGSLKKWESQPSSKSMPLGNLIMAAAILFSGSSAHKFLTLCQHASLQMFSTSTYNTIQMLYLIPTVENTWQLHQLQFFNAIRESGQPLRLGGDGRCCSPGHTAKYLSYTLMDLKTNKIVDTQLIQRIEVKNSYAMELEGLKRGLAKLEEEEIPVSHLVTDRHSQIKKFMRDDHPEITHWFDCWHIAKGIYKKLEAVGKKKKCELVGLWARSISNHTYWCAMSSNGDGDVVLQKWTSILNHVTNVHEGHGPLFPRCEHGIMEERAWIRQGSKAYEELEKVIKGRLLLTDIKKISPAEQTSGLEAFHKVLCHFAPKLVHFFHAQMDARVKIAAMHFNENAKRDQAVNQDGELIYSVSLAKNREGAGVAKEVKVKQTFNYIDQLFEELLFRREAHSSFADARRAIALEDRERPTPLAHSGPRINKQLIVEAHRSRFN